MKVDLLSKQPLVIRSDARILVVRPDRLGDVLLSTPVIEVLKRTYPKASISVLAQPRVAPILRGLTSIHEVLEYDVSGRHSGLSGLWKLIQELRSKKFDLAVVLQAPLKVACAVFIARIPVRIGPLSKWFSWIVFNRRIRQARSRVEMHEADYNLQLLHPLGIFVGHKTISTRAAVSPEAAEEVKSWISRNPIPRESMRWVAVHPGMGGSALNWPESHYFELVQSLLKEGFGVVLTAGPQEEQILQRFRDRFGDYLFFRSFGGAQAPDVQRLAYLYSQMDLVIAPSTGPLHLAVAMKTKTVTFFPPIRVQSAKRWGPYDADSGILMPQVICGQDFHCLGASCRFYPCMNRISVDSVLEEIRNRTNSIGERK